MQRRLFLLTILAIVPLMCAGTDLWGGSGKPVRLRVLSYNIHHGRGIDGKLDLERIAGVIRSVEPDLVALQEVDRKTWRVDGADEPAELARLTGLKVAFEQNIPFAGGEYGNAVLSRFPIKGHKNHVLPCLDEGEQRGMLEVELELPGGRPLLFFSTHLDHRAADRERLACAETINGFILKRAKSPAILAGDLNATPDSRVLKLFTAEWTRAADTKVLPTIPVGEPKRQIDYILFRPSDRWKVVEVRVLDEKVASDHRPIFAVLELDAS